MLTIPFATREGHYNMFILIQDEGLARMKAYDPGQCDIRKLPDEFRNRQLDVIIVGYATAEDVQHVLKLGNSGRMTEALQYLSRGFEFRTDKGDHDGPPLSLRKHPGESTQ